MDFQLRTPAGTLITLMDGEGAPGGGDVLFDDEARLLAEDVNLTTPGPWLRPEQPLNALDGFEASGTWDLVVTDGAPQDTGTLLGWSLRLHLRTSTSSWGWSTTAHRSSCGTPTRRSAAARGCASTTRRRSPRPLSAPTTIPTTRGRSASRSSLLIRLFGAGRVQTAVAVSQESFVDPGTATVAVLATEGNFADALAGTPLAVVANGPLLLTPAGQLATSPTRPTRQRRRSAPKRRPR